MVGPQRRRVLCGLAGDLIGEGGDVGVQAEELVAASQAEGNAARLPSSAAEVKPARGRAEGPL